jgi:hypothetical protein
MAAMTTMMAGPRTVGLGCFSPVQRLDERSEASLNNSTIPHTNHSLRPEEIHVNFQPYSHYSIAQGSRSTIKQTPPTPDKLKSRPNAVEKS